MPLQREQRGGAILGIDVGIGRDPQQRLLDPFGTAARGDDAGHRRASYFGRIVEQADRRTLFVAPRHPYTTGLLGSIPRLDSAEGSPLLPIPGSPTDTLPWASACAFAPRCPRKLEVCTTVTPELEPDGPRRLRCHNPVPAEEAAAVGAEGRRE